MLSQGIVGVVVAKDGLRCDASRSDGGREVKDDDPSIYLEPENEKLFRITFDGRHEVKTIRYVPFVMQVPLLSSLCRPYGRRSSAETAHHSGVFHFNSNVDSDP